MRHIEIPDRKARHISAGLNPFMNINIQALPELQEPVPEWMLLPLLL